MLRRALAQVWIQPGFGLADDYLALVESFTGGNSEITVVALLGIFGLFHSGLAGLRPYCECDLVRRSLSQWIHGGQPHTIKAGLSWTACAQHHPIPSQHQGHAEWPGRAEIAALHGTRMACNVHCALAIRLQSHV